MPRRPTGWCRGGNARRSSARASSPAFRPSRRRSGSNPMSVEKIPVTIITGFLGAGKTTLVRHLMQNPQGRRLAILVNEFGDLGVDGDILKGCAAADCPDDAIFELNNV